MGTTAARSEGPDDLWTGFEVLEGRAFGHNQTLVRPLPCLKQSSSDKPFGPVALPMASVAVLLVATLLFFIAKASQRPS